MTLVFDTETNGKANFDRPPEDECQPRLVQLGALLLDRELQTVGELNLIIKPVGFDIPPEVAKIHGITIEKATNYGVPEKQALELFASWCAISQIIVAHNIAFDGIVLGRANHIHGLTYKPPTPYCTMQKSTDRCKIPGGRGYKWPSLQEAHQILLGTGFEGAHDAMADVRACARVYAFLLTGEKPKTAVAAASPINKMSDHLPRDVEYNDNTLMPFGKWRGTPLGDLPDDYVEWLYKQDNLSDIRLAKWLGKKV
jgi:DNA polymerase-3 subunit epsilon